MILYSSSLIWLAYKGNKYVEFITVLRKKSLEKRKTITFDTRRRKRTGLGEFNGTAGVYRFGAAIPMRFKERHIKESI
jgi:hypothetical protein